MINVKEERMLEGKLMKKFYEQVTDVIGFSLRISRDVLLIRDHLENNSNGLWSNCVASKLI